MKRKPKLHTICDPRNLSILRDVKNLCANLRLCMKWYLKNHL